MTRLFFTGLLFMQACAWSLNAQSGWSLDRCIEYAWENNLNIHQQDLDVRIQKNGVLQAGHDLLPSFSAQSYLTQNYGRSIDPSTNTYIDVQFLNNSYGIYAAVDVFSGFMKLNTIAMEQYNYRAGQNKLVQVKNEVAFSVINGYFDLLLKEGLTSIAQENFQLSKDQLDYTSKLVHVGRKAGTDLLEIEANMAADSFLLVQAHHLLEQASLDLKYQMNFPLSQPLDIDTVIFSIFSDSMDTLTMQVLFDLASGLLPDMKIAENQLIAAKKAVRVSQGSFSPSIGFFAGWNTAYATTLKDENNTIIPFRNQISNNGSEYLSVGIEIPLFSKLSRYTTLSKSKLQYQQAKVRYDDASQKLMMGVEKSLTDWKSARAEYASAQKQLIQSEKAFDAAGKKLEKGLINIIEYYIQKNKLFRAKTEVLRTGLQVLLKERYIRFLMTGSVLGV